MAMTSVTAGRHRFIAGGRRFDQAARYEFARCITVACAGASDAENAAENNPEIRNSRPSRYSNSGRTSWDSHTSNGDGTKQKSSFRGGDGRPALPSSRKLSMYSSPSAPRLPYPNDVSSWKRPHSGVRTEEQQQDSEQQQVSGQQQDSGNGKSPPWAKKHLEEQRTAPRVIPPGSEYLGRQYLEIPRRNDPNRLSGAEYGPEQYHPIGAHHELPTYEVPFEFQYTYSEVPKVEPIAERGPQFSPFGPDSMPRPWCGSAPLETKRKKYIIDSFNPPPPELKKVKPVETAGPFPPGQRPVIVTRREDVLGEPLTQDEITDLVTACYREKRQLNLGRDGVTHNMLDLIHSHWKRRRVLKIKCKGVPTIDLDNVCFHLEDKTGGKIIYRRGGAIFLFRGRNYNPRFRPNIPLMLWKPPVPIYPQLVQQVPEGLTMRQAEFLRKRGRLVKSLCTLTRNGVYLSLAKTVQKAFEVDELVKLDCRRMNPSDIRKIGAKLKELLGAVILSFQDEQVLLWKGPPKPTEDEKALQQFISETAEADVPVAAAPQQLEGTAPQQQEGTDPSPETGTETEEEEAAAEPTRTLTPLQILAAQELEALWGRAVDFGMLTTLDEQQMQDADYIKEAAGARFQLKRLTLRQAETEEVGEEEHEKHNKAERQTEGRKQEEAEWQAEQRNPERKHEQEAAERQAEEWKQEQKKQNRRAIRDACSTLERNLPRPAARMTGVLSVGELAKLLSSPI